MKKKVLKSIKDIEKAGLPFLGFAHRDHRTHKKKQNLVAKGKVRLLKNKIESRVERQVKRARNKATFEVVD